MAPRREQPAVEPWIHVERGPRGWTVHLSPGLALELRDDGRALERRRARAGRARVRVLRPAWSTGAPLREAPAAPEEGAAASRERARRALLELARGRAPSPRGR